MTRASPTSKMLALASLALIFAFAPANPADALDRRVRIVNASSESIVGFYGVSVDTREWRESLLGDDVLPAGASTVLDFDDGSGYCRYRFRAVFGDGVELLQRSVNVCEIGTYRYTD
ncbi:MAG TPA: hypothetical protein VGA77_08340 [Propylenella sp.]